MSSVRLLYGDLSISDGVLRLRAEGHDGLSRRLRVASTRRNRLAQTDPGLALESRSLGSASLGRLSSVCPTGAEDHCGSGSSSSLKANLEVLDDEEAMAVVDMSGIEEKAAAVAAHEQRKRSRRQTFRFRALASPFISVMCDAMCQCRRIRSRSALCTSGAISAVVPRGRWISRLSLGGDVVARHAPMGSSTTMLLPVVPHVARHLSISATRRRSPGTRASS